MVCPACGFPQIFKSMTVSLLDQGTFFLSSGTTAASEGRHKKKTPRCHLIQEEHKTQNILSTLDTRQHELIQATEA